MLIVGSFGAGNYGIAYMPKAHDFGNKHCVTSVQVPKLTVLIGGSFGAGNYGMLICLRHMIWVPNTV